MLKKFVGVCVLFAAVGFAISIIGIPLAIFLALVAFWLIL